MRLEEMDAEIQLRGPLARTVENSIMARDIMIEHGKSPGAFCIASESDKEYGYIPGEVLIIGSGDEEPRPVVAIWNQVCRPFDVDLYFELTEKGEKA